MKIKSHIALALLGAALLGLAGCVAPDYGTSSSKTSQSSKHARTMDPMQEAMVRQF